MIDGDAAAAAAPAMNVINPADLRHILSTPLTDIPIFYGDEKKDTVTAKFLYDRMKLAVETNHWNDADAGGNFCLQLRGKALEWLEFVRDTEGKDVRLWSIISEAFKDRYDLAIDTITNVWDLTSLKHEEKQDPRELAVKVSKIINDVQASNSEFTYTVRNQYTAEQVRAIVKASEAHLMTHFKKTMLIKHLQPAIRDFVLSRHPINLEEASIAAVDYWKRKNNGRTDPPKAEIAAITTDLESLANIPEEVLLFALNQRKNGNQNWRTGNGNDGSNKPQGKNKNKNKNKGNSSQNNGNQNQGAQSGNPSQQGNQEGANKSSNSQNGQPNGNNGRQSGQQSGGRKIYCWYCKKIGHLQLICHKRIGDNAPLTYRNKPIMGQNNKAVMALSDLDSQDMRDEWMARLRTQALEDPNTQQGDFQ